MPTLVGTTTVQGDAVITGDLHIAGSLALPHTIVTHGDGDLTTATGTIVFVNNVTTTATITMPPAIAGNTVKFIFGTNDGSSNLVLRAAGYDALSYNDIRLAEQLVWSDLSEHIPVAFPSGQYMDCYSIDTGTWFITPRGTVTPIVSHIRPTVTTNTFGPQNLYTPIMRLTGTVTDGGDSRVTERGVVWSFGTFVPTIDDNKVPCDTSGIGEFTVDYDAGNTGYNYARAYAINRAGVSYGDVLTETSHICLAAGTLVTLRDFTKVPIENIKYDDLLLVWNFDDGRLDGAYPLWIKREESAECYNKLEFSDGTTLKTINQHRIFNKEAGKFTYPMTDETPIGCTTYKETGECVKLVSKGVIDEPVKYYNVITARHLNLFADSILTSCRYNNIYPINNMLYTKSDRSPVPKSEFPTLPPQYYDGLRLAEQLIPVSETIKYVRRLEARKI